MSTNGLIDYHLHTNTSSDAVATVSEYCEHASALGLAEIAITNHMNVRTAKYDVSPEELAAVRDEIEALRPRYPGLTIRLGVEVDYFADHEDEIARRLDTYERTLGHPLDVVLVGLHVLRNVRFASKKQAPRLYSTAKVEDLFRDYLDLLSRAIRSGRYDVLAHPDLIKRFTPKLAPRVPFSSVREQAEPLVHALLDTGTAMEINVKGLEHPVREAYPSDDLLALYLELAAARGVTPRITLGSDAHAVDGMGLHFDDGVRMLARHGVTQLTTYVAGRAMPFPLPKNTLPEGARS
jgi:histidinol-phosphatase (PHP family)